MMTVAGGIFVVLGFLVFVKLFGLVKKSTTVISIARSAALVVRDTSFDDHQKELAMRGYAKRLFSLFLFIAAASIVALAIPLGVIWLMERMGLMTLHDVIKTTLSLKFIAFTVIASIVLLGLMRREPAGASLANSYSSVDKILHYSALNSWSTLIALSGIESRIFKKQLANIQIRKPVFITALPRAGTTLLLELCVGTKEFVSHTYRDMPFLLTPLLWNGFSKYFKYSELPRERAHGDGMMIHVDSPEAFEEIIWKGFWPSRYRKDRIVPWVESNYSDFEEFLHDHLRKVILLRGGTISSRDRYVSKDNLHIARIGYLKRIFSDSIIIIPFRAPLQHASSLLRQHQNFLNIHKEDAFACNYMETIGHYDFGKNLRPVDFDSWFSSEQASDPNTLVFWLRYWISTYRHLLMNARDHVTFFSYDSFCSNRERGLEKFGELIEINNIESLLEKADRIVVPKPYSVDVNSIAPDILNQAETLHMDLKKVSLP